MFSHWKMCWALVSLLGALLASELYAQVYPRPLYQRRPPISPYIDLLRRVGPTYMYYRRIRPELEMRRQLQLNQMQLQHLQTRVALQGERLNRLIGTRFGSIVLPRPSFGGAAGVSGIGQGMPPTGHPTAFGDLGGYFPGLGGGSVGVPASGVGLQAPPPPPRPRPPTAERYRPPTPRHSGPSRPNPPRGVSS